MQLRLLAPNIELRQGKSGRKGFGLKLVEETHPSTICWILAFAFLAFSMLLLSNYYTMKKHDNRFYLLHIRPWIALLQSHRRGITK